MVSSTSAWSTAAMKVRVLLPFGVMVVIKNSFSLVFSIVKTGFRPSRSAILSSSIPDC